MLAPNFQAKLDEMVNKVFRDNSEELENALLSGINSSQDRDIICYRMIQNSMRISSIVSTKIILELLVECGLLSISEDSRDWIKVLKPDD